MKLSQRGVTLIELLVAVSLTVIVGLGVYKAFANGVEIWNWQKKCRVNGDMLVFFERLAGDIHNGFGFKQGDFEGSPEKMSFYVHNTDYELIDVSELKNMPVKEPIYMVVYYIKGEEKELYRKVCAYGSEKVLSDKVVLKGVKDIGFSYYAPGAGDGSLEFFRTWEGIMPYAIGAEIIFNDWKGRERKYEKVFEVPVEFKK